MLGWVAIIIGCDRISIKLWKDVLRYSTSTMRCCWLVGNLNYLAVQSDLSLPSWKLQDISSWSCEINGMVFCCSRTTYFIFLLKKFCILKFTCPLKMWKKKKNLKSLYISAFTGLREIIKYSDGPCYLSIISLKYFYLFKIIESVINLCLKKFSN